jgi:hypothetical protein
MKELVIFCESIREEKNEKYSLLGVIPGDFAIAEDGGITFAANLTIEFSVEELPITRYIKLEFGNQANVAEISIPQTTTPSASKIMTANLHTVVPFLPVKIGDIIKFSSSDQKDTGFKLLHQAKIIDLKNVTPAPRPIIKDITSRNEGTALPTKTSKKPLSTKPKKAKTEKKK